MRRSFNKVMLYGNLTSDPEVRPTKTGRSFTTFSIATNRDWKTKDSELVSETDFHKIVAFGKLGEIVGKHLKKGHPILVSGRLHNRSYETNEGGKRHITEVVIDDFNFLPRGKREREQEEVAPEAELSPVLA